MNLGWLLLTLTAVVCAEERKGTAKYRQTGLIEVGGEVLLCATGPPPKVPPETILGELTQEHQIPVKYYYVDDSNKGQGNVSCKTQGGNRHV